MASVYPSLTLRTGDLLGLDTKALELGLGNQQALLFHQTGVIPPQINFHHDQALGERNCRFFMDETCLVSFTTLAQDEFWASVELVEVAHVGSGRNWKAREQVLTGLRAQGCILEGDEAARDFWVNQGYGIAADADYVLALVSATLNTYKCELLVPALVEYYLTRLAANAPVLISSIRQRFKPEELTLALQSKLQSLGSVKHLTGVLEEILAEKVIRA